MSGGVLARGFFVQGFLSGGLCPGGFCLGVFVLIPLRNETTTNRPEVINKMCIKLTGISNENVSCSAQVRT